MPKASAKLVPRLWEVPACAGQGLISRNSRQSLDWHPLEELSIAELLVSQHKAVLHSVCMAKREKSGTGQHATKVMCHV